MGCHISETNTSTAQHSTALVPNVVSMVNGHSETVKRQGNMSSKQNPKEQPNLISRYFKHSTQKETDLSQSMTSAKKSNTVRQPKTKSVKSKSDAIYLNIISNREKATPVSPTVAGSECKATHDSPIVTDSESDVNLKAKYVELQKKYIELEVENKKLLKDNKLLKKLLSKAESVNMYKDHQLIERNVISNTAMLFEKYASSFTSHHLKELRSISGGKPQDCTFVSKIVECFYPEGVEHKCVAKKRGQQKEKTPITPDKLEIIGKMLKERIMSEKVSGNVIVERHSRLNTLIGYALQNKKRKPISIEQTGLAYSNQFAFSNLVSAAPAHYDPKADHSFAPAHYDQKADHSFVQSTHSPVHTPIQNSQPYNWPVTPQNIVSHNFPNQFINPSASFTPYTTNSYTNAPSVQHLNNFENLNDFIPKRMRYE